MSTEILQNKPLVEAILEVKWALKPAPNGPPADPHYKLLLGRFFDRVCARYPEHEQLPTANIPDEMVGHMAQHRFRAGKDDWPLIQIGPGVLSVNDTENYTWTDFRERGLEAVRQLYDSYPQRDELNVESLVLRYIDATEFDHTSEDCLKFFAEKMGVSICFPEHLFGGGVEKRPSHLNCLSSFRCQEPPGMVSTRFATGQKHGEAALIWETMVQSAGHGDLPAMPDGFEGWFAAAHGVVHQWFMTLIEGDLRREFQGE